MNSYARAAIDAEIGALRAASSGRACATFRAAAAIGGFVAAGAIDHDEAEQRLVDAAIATGLREREAFGHIRRGLRRGEQTRRVLPDVPLSPHRGLPRVHHPLETEQRLARPPQAEIEALWSASLPVEFDPEVRAWLSHRFDPPEQHPPLAQIPPEGTMEFCHPNCHPFRHHASDVQHAVSPIVSGNSSEFCYRHRSSWVVGGIELWDLCRAIPADLDLPRWAWSRGGPWTRTGHRALFRLWDHDGRAASVRARCVKLTEAPKSLAPSGFSVKGLVLADPLGVQLLSGSVPQWWVPRQVIISEGEVDWATWAMRQQEADPQGPACFGIEAGAWSKAIAARIPEGSSVVLRTDHDEVGDRYAEQITVTLRGRCHLFRSLPEVGAGR